MAQTPSPDWAAQVPHPERATSARVYNYLLGGVHYLEADRQVGEAMQQAMPWVPLQARGNRAFLRRAVRFMVGAGIRQFVDIGSGIPDAGNVHEVAQDLCPDSRVVYVDSDQVAVMQSLQMLAGLPTAAALEGDLTRPEQILDDLASAEFAALINPDQPVGLLLVAVTHFVPDEVVYDAVATLRDWLPPGSYLTLSQGAAESYTPEQVQKIRAAYARQTAAIPTARTWEQTARFFDGLELVDPGLVYYPLWRPEPDDPDDFAAQPRACGSWAGAALKPA